MGSRIAVIIGILTCAGLRVAADVAVLPGYRLEVISAGLPGSHLGASMNNNGQIVWMWQADSYDATTREIMLYDNGAITRITNNNTYDMWPDINDQGEIVWESPTGLNQEWEIWIWRDGVARRLVEQWPPGTPPQRDNWGGKINNLGHVVWSRQADVECSGADADLWWYDEAGARQLTNVGLSNQLADLNDLDEIVWTRYNFCQSPWTSQIMLLSNGAVSVLSPATPPQVQNARINIRQEVLWEYGDPTPGAAGASIAYYWQGSLSRLMLGGEAASINDNSWIAISRYNADGNGSQAWLMTPTQTSQLTNNEPYHNGPWDINELGEIAWAHGSYPTVPMELRAYLRYSLGDLNCDEFVSLQDIAPFVQALVDAEEYAVRFPACDALLADFNGDQHVTVTDIAPMVSALLQ